MTNFVFFIPLPNTAGRFIIFLMCFGSRYRTGGNAWLPVGEILEDRNAGSVFFLCVSDQGVQDETAYLPVGEVFEDRDGDRGEDAQVRTCALPTALCTIIFHIFHEIYPICG